MEQYYIVKDSEDDEIGIVYSGTELQGNGDTYAYIGLCAPLPRSEPTCEIL